MAAPAFFCPETNSDEQKTVRLLGSDVIAASILDHGKKHEAILPNFA